MEDRKKKKKKKSGEKRKIVDTSAKSTGCIYAQIYSCLYYTVAGAGAQGYDPTDPDTTVWGRLVEPSRPTPTTQPIHPCQPPALAPARTTSTHTLMYTYL